MVSNSGCQPGKRLLARYFRILSCVLPSSLVIHNLSEENDDMQIKFLYCAGGCTGCEKLARQIDKVHLENVYKMGLEL